MDEPDQPTEAGQETEPQPVEKTEQETTSEPPWGDDFSPEKAWSTIQTQRQAEKELKEQVKQQRETLMRDPEYLQQVLDAHNLQLADDDETPEHDYPDLEDEDELTDPSEQRLTVLEQQIQEQRELDDLRAFEAHLDELAEGAKTELSQRDRRYLLDASAGYGFTPESTEKAFKEWLEDRKAHDKQVIDEWAKGKTGAPHAPGSGTEATNDALPLDASPQQRQQWMTERYRLNQQ